MRRKLFNLATAVSLALCVTTCLSWITSYIREHGMFAKCDPLIGRDKAIIVAADRGRMFAMHRWMGSGYSASRPAQSRWPVGLFYASGGGLAWDADMLTATSGRHFLGFAFAVPRIDPTTYRSSLPLRVLIVPHAAFVVLFAVTPAVAFRRHFRLPHRRRAAGLCPTCGYDCRATPDRCPECGTPIKAGG